VGLAAQLTLAEALVRDPTTSAAALAWEGWLQELDYTKLVANPAWDQPVLQQIPVWLQQPAGEIIDASRQQLALSEESPLPTGLPSWRIVAPAPAAELLADYQAAAAETGVPWEYLAAINLVETYMGRIRGTSTAGAQGPMQFLPSSWSSYGQGGDINSDHDAIMAAARLLRAGGAPDRMPAALLRYNPSSHYVAAVSDYARAMEANSRSYLGFYGWQVYYPTSRGDVLLPVGYGS
jgi:membrane-bound lytic murein transglycosylase B